MQRARSAGTAARAWILALLAILLLLMLGAAVRSALDDQKSLVLVQVQEQLLPGSATVFVIIFVTRPTEMQKALHGDVGLA